MVADGDFDMGVMLDGQALFDAQWSGIEVGSAGRETMERAVPGLDGVLSIDLGMRTRKIKQKGTLSAVSRAQMQERIGAISGFMDGDTHTLVYGSEAFDDVRMDSFKVGNERMDGRGLVVDYEIAYTQLRVG